MDFREFCSINNAIKLEREKLESDQKDARIKELVDVLESLIDDLEADDISGALLIAKHGARAAIAKAKGGEND